MDSHPLIRQAWHAWDQGDWRHGLQLLRQAVETSPADPAAWAALATAQQRLGNSPAARQAYGFLLQQDPHSIPARWLLNRLLPRIYQTQDEIAHWRRQAALGIRLLADTVHPTTPEQAAQDLHGVLLSSNFDLAYQAQDDRPLQQAWGQMICRVMAARFPTLPPPRPTPAAGRRIRVGYASSYFHRHTIAMLFAGWIAHADRRNFQIHTYLTGGPRDSNSEQLARRSDVFRDVRGPLDQAVQAIHGDQLDILVYPDLGMDPRSQCLAGLRLAPVQCLSWGHPVTSGLPTMDYFLSSAAMEPADSQSCYSEKLVCLPNLSIAYAPPPRSTLMPQGLPDGRRYLCCQAQQKYLPQHDHLLVDIARQIADARFLFILHKTRHHDNAQFMGRLRRVFAAAGLPADRHLCFTPWLDWPLFLATAAQCHVFLDTVDWSGGNTSLECLSQGLPCVTLPGRFMRGRHTHAMLSLMGLDECIATDAADYVRIAVRLGQDEAYRQQIQAHIAQHYPTLCNDVGAVRALETFYRSVIGS